VSSLLFSRRAIQNEHRTFSLGSNREIRAMSNDIMIVDERYLEASG